MGVRRENGMDENKNLNVGQPEENQVSPEEEAAAETAENTEGASDNAEATEKADKKDKKAKKEKKEKKEKRQKPKKLRNQALLRRGGFSIAITAAVLAGIIVVNILVSALADRFVLEFDMSTEKQNAMNEENIDYLRDLETEVEIIVCATPEDYVGGYMSYLAQNMYGVSSDATQYYDQTIKLLDKYPAYNSKISLRYVDTQSSEFNEITSTYSNEQLNYGDIIVFLWEEENKYLIKRVIGLPGDKIEISYSNEDEVYYVYRNVGVNISQNIGINIKIRIDFNNILFAHFAAGNIFYKRHRAVKRIKPQKIVNPHTLSGGNVVDYYSVLYGIDIHLFHLQQH